MVTVIVGMLSTCFRIHCVPLVVAENQRPLAAKQHGLLTQEQDGILRIHENHSHHRI